MMLFSSEIFVVLLLWLRDLLVTLFTAIFFNRPILNLDLTLLRSSMVKGQSTWGQIFYALIGFKSDSNDLGTNLNRFKSSE